MRRMRREMYQSRPPERWEVGLKGPSIVGGEAKLKSLAKEIEEMSGIKAVSQSEK